MRPGIIIRHAWGSYIFNIIFHHCHCHDWLGDILPQRHFGLGAFCPTGILPHGHFAPRAFCPKIKCPSKMQVPLYNFGLLATKVL